MRDPTPRSVLVVISVDGVVCTATRFFDARAHWERLGYTVLRYDLHRPAKAKSASARQARKGGRRKR